MARQKTGGRKKGSLNRATAAKAAQVPAMAAEIAVTGDTPLDYLLRVMRNDEAEFLLNPGADLARRARQRGADKAFQGVFLRGARKARAPAHVETGQTLDPTLFKEFEPATDRIVVQQQRIGHFLTAPPGVQKHQGVCAARHPRGRRELGVRVFAARSAAPYVHPRLSAVTVTRVSDKETLEELERKAIRLGKKIGLGDLTSLFAAAKH